MEHIKLRRGVPPYAATTCDVVRRSIQELCIADHRNDQATLAAWLANKHVQWFERLLSSETGTCVVAKLDRKPCGFGLLNHPGEICLLYVAPEARFMGVSSAFLRGTRVRGVGRSGTRLWDIAAVPDGESPLTDLML